MGAVSPKNTTSQRAVTTSLVVVMLVSNLAPLAAALATPALPAPLEAASSASFADDYAHQLLVLQNPVADPGFEVGPSTPAWRLSPGAAIEGGRLYLGPGAVVSQDFAFTTEDASLLPPDVADALDGLDLGLSASALTHASRLTFRADGVAGVSLSFVESSTGRVFGGARINTTSGLNHVPATAFLALDASGHVLDADGTSTGATPSQLLPLSAPHRLTFLSLPDAPNVHIDDVILDGVEYGAPTAHLELDGLRVSDELDATLADALGDAHDPDSLGYAHDGYTLLVLPLDFTPAAGGALRAAADAAAFAREPGTWHFAVFAAEHGPSGTRLLDADSLADARLLLNLTPTLAATGDAATPRRFVTLADTPYAGISGFTGDDLDARGIVFRTSQLALEHVTLVGVWNTPSDEGGIYPAPDARGFFHPAKVTGSSSPVMDAADALAAPLAAFAIGAVPCAGAESLTFRFGDADCDAESDVDEALCSVDTSQGVSVSPLSPDPLDARTTCVDPDGDGLVADYDPQPQVAGALVVSLAPDANGDWWRGQRVLGFTLENTFNGENEDVPLTIRTAVVFQGADDVDLEGMRADCDGGDIVTAAALVTGTCYFQTIVPEGDGYRVLLLAEVLQPPHAAPAFARELGRPIGVDLTPPNATGLLVEGTAGLRGWHVSPVDVAFATSDALSGIDRVECAIGGSAFAACDALRFAVAGRTDLAFRAIDEAGNAESTKTRSFFLSLADPTVTCTPTTPALGENGWHLAPFDVRCDAVADTGAADIAVALDGGAPAAYDDAVRITTAGTHRLDATATDLAGRASAVASTDVGLDLLAPRTTLDVAGDLVGGSLYSSAVSIGFDVQDDASGVSRTLVSVDGAAPRSIAPGDRVLVTQDGAHSLTFYSVDAAGREEPAQVRELVVDRAAPQTIRSITGTLGTNGWYRSDLLVELASTDDASGVARIEYVLDGSAPATYTGPIAVSGDGQHLLVYYAIDNASNPEPMRQVRLDIDSTPPEVTLDLQGTQGLGGWHLGSVEVNVTAADATSGLGDVLVLVGEGGYQPYAGPLTVTAQGLSSVAAYATDLAGNAAPVRSAQVKIDRVDPTTAVSLDGPVAENGWFAGPVQVALAAADAVSGIAGLEYSLDGEAYLGYAAPFNVTGDRAHELRTRARDVAGNVEDDTLTLVRIDTTPPGETLLTPDGLVGDDGWYRGPVTLSFAPQDATSGVRVLRVSTDGGASYASLLGAGPHEVTIPETGTYDLVWQARDHAGHVEASRSARVKLDLEAPTTVATLTGGSAVAPWINEAPATLALAATDPAGGSGVATVEHRIANGTWTAYTGALVFPTDGEWTVEYRATDAAGNVEPARNVTVRVDTTKPTVGATLLGDVGLAGWYTGPVQVYLNATDATSGAAHVTYRVDDGAWVQSNASVAFTLDAQGATTLAYRAVDVAGNLADEANLTLRIDRVTPSTTTVLAGDAGGNGTFTSAVLVTLQNASGPSGAATEYRVDGGAVQTYAEPFLLATQGTFAVAARSTSGAGLVEAWNETTVRIDLEDPVTSLVAVGERGENASHYRSNVTVTLTPADSFSGPASSEYSLDGGAFRTYEGPFVLSKLGGTNVSFRSADHAGRVETAKHATFLVDWSAPVTTAVTDGPAGAAGWFRGPVNVTLVATAGPSGVAATTFAVDGGEMQPYARFQLVADGVHDVGFQSTSGAGVAEALRSLAVPIDATAPASLLTPSGTRENEGYWTSLVTVSLNASDNGSGVERIEYRVNGGNWTRYDGPVTPPLTGEVTFERRAIDVAGNVEAPIVFTYFVDTDVPVSTLTLVGVVGENGWYTSNVTALLAATAGPSGIDRIAWRDNGGDFANYTAALDIGANGAHLFDYGASSRAGLTEPTRNASFRIDTVAPVTNATVHGAAGAAGYFVSRVNVTLHVTEATSGVNATWYRLDGGAWTPYTGPIAVVTSGTHELLMRSADNAGNLEVARNVTFALDVDEVVTTISVNGTEGAAGWLVGNATVSFAAQGGPSGIARTDASVDGADWTQVVGGQLDISADGVHQVRTRSVNGAGVVESPVKTREVRIDQTAPAAAHALSPADGLDGWHTGVVTFSITAEDLTSGVRAIDVRVDDGPWMTFLGNATTLNVTAPGHHAVAYRAVDEAGIVSLVQGFAFKIDDVTPESVATLNGTLGENGWYTSAATLALAATGGPSNVSAIFHGVSGNATTPYESPLAFHDGVHVVSYAATSGAGLVEPVRNVTFKVDATAPTTTLALAGASLDGWFVEPVTVFVNASDATSGLARVECSVDGAPFGACASPFVVSKQGSTRIEARATDLAGNVEAIRNATFRLDTVGPAIHVSAAGPEGRAPWFVGPVTVQVSAIDPAPGHGSVVVLRDGEPSPASFQIDANGTTSHVFTSADALLNAGNGVALQVQIDPTVPVTTHVVDATLGENGWLRSAARVTLANVTGPSGSYATRYALDGAAGASYDGPVLISGEGNHTMTYATESGAGLIEADQTLQLRIDTVAPTSTLSLAGQAGANGWFLSSVDASLAGADAMSGVASCEYRVGEGAFVAASTLVLSDEGVHDVAHRCTDAAGNVGPTVVTTVRIDRTDPAIGAAIVAGTQGLGGHHVTPVTLGFTTTEATSGIARILVSRNGAPYVAANATHVIDAQGASTLQYHAVDQAGRVSATGEIALLIDSIAPAISAVLHGDVGDDSWYTSAVTVNLTAADGGSGVVARSYSLDGSADFDCTCAVTVATSGVHVVNATARDAAGNVGTLNGIQVKIDTVAPTTVASLSGTQGQNGWFVGAVTLTFAASDDLSQVRHVLASVDNGPYTATTGTLTVAGDGAHIVRFRAQDNAGNLETVQTRAFSIDTTPPTPSATRVGTMGAAGWYRSNVSVALGASDGGSGVAQLRYRLNNASEQAYTGPFLVEAEGATDVSYRAIDSAGIASDLQTVTVRIDTQAPTATAAAAGALGANGWYTSAVSVTLTGSDAAPGSGALAPTYAVDGGAPQAYAAPFVVSGEGAHVVTYSAADVAGNAGATRTLSLAIDTTKPTVALASTPFGAGVHTRPVTVNLTTSDAGSGLLAREVRIDGGAWQPYFGNVTVATSGAHVVEARATDRAGLVSDVASVSFSIDLVEPTLDVTPYRTNVPTATPSVAATFGPVFAGWDAARAVLYVDGEAAPGCVATGGAALVITCTPIAWTEAFALSSHDVRACATTLAGKVWCSDDLLSRAGRLPWSFTVNPDDWDRDGHLNNRETRYGSLPFDPYSVPYDPQGWNLRATPNDPDSALVASDSQNLSQAQSFVKLRFAQYAYASDPSASFAPNRTAVVASLERLAVMEPGVATTPSVAVRAGAREAASITLGATETTLRVADQAPVVIPARAVVEHEAGDTSGALTLRVLARGATLAEVELVEGGAVVATIYGEDGETIARYPTVDSDGDAFTAELERAFGSSDADPTETPVPATDLEDDYAVVLQPLGAVAPEAPAVVVVGAGGSFPVLLHVDDMVAGGRASLAGARVDFAVLPLAALAAFAPALPAPAGGVVYDTDDASPAGRDPRALAHWSASCVIGEGCSAMRLADSTDATRVIIDIPSAKVAAGPYVLWARAHVADRAGVESAAGFYSAPKAALHDAGLPDDGAMRAEEEQDYSATPVVFARVPAGSPLAADADGDGYTTAQELGVDGTRGSRSDPMDEGSTPVSDDDGDGCLNRDEAVPSWLVATPRGCALDPEVS